MFGCCVVASLLDAGTEGELEERPAVVQKGQLVELASWTLELKGIKGNSAECKLFGHFGIGQAGSVLGKGATNRRTGDLWAGWGTGRRIGNKKTTKGWTREEEGHEGAHVTIFLGSFAKERVTILYY